MLNLIWKEREIEKKREWTQEEIDYIKKNLRESTSLSLAKKFNRSPQQIRSKITYMRNKGEITGYLKRVRRNAYKNYKAKTESGKVR